MIQNQAAEFNLVDPYRDELDILTRANSLICDNDLYNSFLSCRKATRKSII